MRRHLTDRDVEILIALDRSPLTVTQILRLSQTFAGQPFTSPRSVQDRLQKMRGAGWVCSWPYAIVSRGSSPDYYKTTAIGFHLLHGENAVPPAKRHFSEVSVANHYHTQRLADFIVHTLVAAHRRAVRVANFYRENTLHLPIEGDSLRPDCAFEIHMSDGRQFNFLVELDNSTERIRSDKDTESWQRKIRLYNGLQDRNYPDRFRVLVVTTRSSERLRSILTLAAEHATNPHRSLLYGVYLGDYLGIPDAMYSPCFRNHRDEAVALVRDATPVSASPPPPATRTPDAPLRPPASTTGRRRCSHRQLRAVASPLCYSARLAERLRSFPERFAIARSPLSAIASPRGERAAEVRDESRPAPVDIGRTRPIAFRIGLPCGHGRLGNTRLVENRHMSRGGCFSFRGANCSIPRACPSHFSPNFPGESF